MDYTALARLVEQAKKDDDEAFAKLYKIFSKSLYYVSLRITKNEDDAHDAVQEAMLILYNNLHKIENNKTIVAYANRVVYNQCLLIMRKKQRALAESDTDFDVQNIQDYDEEFIPEKYVDQKEQRKYMIGLIDDTLLKIGIPYHLSGFLCLKTALLFTLDNPNQRRGVYKAVCNVLGITRHSADKNMRTAIESCVGSDLYLTLFGKFKESNVNFVYGLTYYIEKQLRGSGGGK